jgi:DNA-binding transcriptional LysR family regulator
MSTSFVIKEMNSLNDLHSFMEFNLDHLVALKEIAKDGSFSRAATRLHLSQPAVSHQIRELEERVGVQLLERVGKNARPTKAGTLLLQHASRALSELDAASEKLLELRSIVAGCVRFGTGGTAATYLLPPFLNRFHSKYTEAELSLVTGNTVEIAAAVMKNDLDVALVTLPITRRQLSVRPFFRDELVAIAPHTRTWK